MVLPILSEAELCVRCSLSIDLLGLGRRFKWTQKPCEWVKSHIFLLSADWRLEADG